MRRVPAWVGVGHCGHVGYTQRLDQITKYVEGNRSQTSVREGHYRYGEG